MTTRLSRHRLGPSVLLLLLIGIAFSVVASHPAPAPPASSPGAQDPAGRDLLRDAEAMILAGRETFRSDTFGSEAFWGRRLRLHDAITGAAHGGVGPGLSPAQALGLGLKVDVEALGDLRAAIVQGAVDLDDAAVTVELLRIGAVIGVTGFFAGDLPGRPGVPPPSGRLRAVGIQCALCHSTVDDALLPGIGRRLDGWANRDLDIGAIVATAPDLSPFVELLGVPERTVREVLGSWGPGKFNAELLLDGKAVTPGGAPAATLIPPIFGLAGVNLHTWTGWGSVTHWNAFVANIAMQGKGTFYDPRLDDAQRFPVAARAGLGDIRNVPDRITPQLAALHVFQLALVPPEAPAGSFDRARAERGNALFEGRARCATCHVPPLFTEPGWNLHTPEEIGIDRFQSSRAPDERYRTSPLKGLWTHATGGFYHDGRFATLRDVVNHYDAFLRLGLDQSAKEDLVEYLRSL